MNGMFGRAVLVVLLAVVGSYANAANVVVGNGVSWTTMISGVGTNTGTVTLNADVSGATLGGGTAFLAGVGIKNLGASDASPFKITSISLPGWAANNDELNASGSACAGGTATANKRACAYALTAGDRVALADGDLSIVFGVTMASGEISDNFHLKVRWEDAAGNKIGSLISEDLSAVPLPAAAWLFASALTGLTIVARRRDKKVKV